MAISTKEPCKLTAGTTVQWTRQLSDYPASGGWVLAYSLFPVLGGAKISIDTTAVGDLHSVDVSAEDSAEWLPGDYTLFGIVTNGAVKHSVVQAKVTILPDPTTATAYDPRSFEEKNLPILEASIHGIAGMKYNSMSMGQKTLGAMSMVEKEQLRDKWLLKIHRQKHGDNPTIIHTTFAQ